MLGITPQVLRHRDTALGSLIASSCLCSRGKCQTHPRPLLCWSRKDVGQSPLHLSLTTSAENPGLRNSSRFRKPQTWWPQRSHKLGNCPALSPPPLSSRLHCSPALPASPQTQLHLREGPSPCALGLQKYSLRFWSLPLPQKGWRRATKSVGKTIRELLQKKAGEWTRIVQPRKQVLGGSQRAL